MNDSTDDSTHARIYKGHFDVESAVWRRTVAADGSPGKFDVGFADNGLVGLRDAKAPDSAVLVYTPAEWDAFVEAAQDGEFDFAVLEATAYQAADSDAHGADSDQSQS